MIVEGSATRLTSVVTDDPPDDLTFAGHPSGLDDPTAAEPTFTGPDDGTYVFTVEVCDPAPWRTSPSATVSVTCRTSRRPWWTPVADVVGNAGTPATLDVVHR